MHTRTHTPGSHGSHAHTKGLTLTLNKRKHTHPTVLCGISLYLFTLIGFQCVCRTVQTVSYKDGGPTSPSLPPPSPSLFPLPNTLPPLSSAAGKEEASAKGKYVCNLPFALPLVPYILSHVPLLCWICRVNKRWNKLINIVLLVCQGAAQREFSSIIKQSNYIQSQGFTELHSLINPLEISKLHVKSIMSKLFLAQSCNLIQQN